MNTTAVLGKLVDYVWYLEIERGNWNKTVIIISQLELSQAINDYGIDEIDHSEGWPEFYK